MKATLSKVTQFSPAKINLFLAVTGVREDDFHELLSLVVPLDFGDSLHVSWTESTSPDELACDYPGVPTNEANLVLQAAAAFREHVQLEGHLHFTIQKVIPPGAGLGGGSSNAVAALQALNQLCGAPLSPATLLTIAAQLGSDCPLFLEPQPIILRGRGERLEAVDAKVLQAICGQQLALFRPDFAIATPWVYQQMRAKGTHYSDPIKAEASLHSWLAQPTWTSIPLVNDLQGPVFQKYPALPCLLDLLRERFGLRCMMSGSGSSCFALLEPFHNPEAIRQRVVECLGPDCFFKCVTIRG